VWRLQSDTGNATDIQVFDDPLVIVNLTVWTSIDALKAFAFHGIHREFFRRRAEWFVEGSTRTAMWWLPTTELPTTDDAKRRLDFVDAFGASPYAFQMGQVHHALTMRITTAADDDVRHLLSLHGWVGEQPVDNDGVIVAGSTANRRHSAGTAPLTRPPLRSRGSTFPFCGGCASAQRSSPARTGCSCRAAAVEVRHDTQAVGAVRALRPHTSFVYDDGGSPYRVHGEDARPSPRRLA
jgi:hypothetical protein